MDFKANLKGVKAKVEEERKGSAPQQVDFRAVLGKKGAAGNGNKPAETPGKNAADFRSVLANKKKPTSPEKNGESDTATPNHCVDGGINSKKSGGAGGGGGAGEEQKQQQQQQQEQQQEGRPRGSWRSCVT
ncbi:myosin light chain kinase, smooth muscle-like [Clinocottus analis]|uniref:myosin light chain kinase, smooth muscle-like n=1 Tax=Clinocottus analis TaxID=304258 RepID=UPI0035C0C83E